MTTGEQIAKAFSDDKCHLSDAELRRLAGMIDAANKAIPQHAVCLFVDGNQWCAVHRDFVNLQESPAGFGTTREQAYRDLTKVSDALYGANRE